MPGVCRLEKLYEEGPQLEVMTMGVSGGQSLLFRGVSGFGKLGGHHGNQGSSKDAL